MKAHVFITGFVQGVGFRRFVRHHALKLELTGWVKNLLDNRVEAVFEGSKEQLKEIISICQKGAYLSEVRNVVVEWGNESQFGAEEFKDFRIL
jgi:acylphosphatase